MSFRAAPPTRSGIGLAAAYIEGHLRSWGVKPAGDHGGYLQTVRVLGVKTTSRASVTVEVDGETRTFTDGDGITLPKNMGGKRRFTVDRVEFAGYGLDAPGAGHTDYRGKDVKDAAVVWLGSSGPDRTRSGDVSPAADGSQPICDGSARRGGGDRPRSRGRTGGRGRKGRRAGRVGRSVWRPGRVGHGGCARRWPRHAAAGARISRRFSGSTRWFRRTSTASDGFFEFLFSRAPESYDALKRKAAAQEPLPSFRLEGVKITFNIDADYQVVRTQLTHNIVAMVEGTDPQLKNTFVAFGAHYDHVGYAEGEVTRDDNGARRAGARGRVTRGAEDDRIWNGADDDGSGTVALMALAKAFAAGPQAEAIAAVRLARRRGERPARLAVLTRTTRRSRWSRSSRS